MNIQPILPSDCLDALLHARQASALLAGVTASTLITTEQMASVAGYVHASLDQVIEALNAATLASVRAKREAEDAR